MLLTRCSWPSQGVVSLVHRIHVLDLHGHGVRVLGRGAVITTEQSGASYCCISDNETPLLCWTKRIWCRLMPWGSIGFQFGFAWDELTSQTWPFWGCQRCFSSHCEVFHHNSFSYSAARTSLAEFTVRVLVYPTLSCVLC